MKIPKISFFEQTKEPKYKNKGYIRASYAQSIAAIPASIASVGIVKAMTKVSELAPKDTAQLRKATQTGLKDTGLYDKGVRAYTIHQNPILPKIKETLTTHVNNIVAKKETFDEMLDTIIPESEKILKFNRKDYKALNAIETEVKSTKRFTRLTKMLGEEAGKTIASVGAKVNALIFKEGKNACFLPNANKIITPDKSLQTSIFHEMGHALNYNGGGFLKILQKARPAAMILPTIILTDALLNQRKTTDEKLENNSVKNRVQNFRDGVKKHAGLLTGLAMLPLVAEEGIASLRGQGVAKKLVQNGQLSKNIYNKIKLTNLGGFASYALAAISAVATAKFAIKVKDNIQAKYEAKKLAKFEAKQAKKQEKTKKA